MPSKVIKLQEEVYNGLDALRGKRETFSEVVGRLLAARNGLIAMSDVLEGKISYQEWLKHPEVV